MWSNNSVGLRQRQRQPDSYDIGLRQRQRQADIYDIGRRFPVGAWTVALVTVPAAAVLFLGYARRHVSDDAMIYSRTVRQIVAGNGPVFNVGERAESSTSALWQWLLALAHWLTRIEVEQLAIFGSLLLTTAAFVVALDGTRRFHQSFEARHLLMPAGIILLLGIPPIWDFATTGLESGLETFWLAACWWLLVGSRSAMRRRSVLCFSAVVGLGPLIRPEFSLVTVVFLIAALLNLRPPLKEVISALCLAGALPVGYEIFRAGYYGLLVPLPALAKEASATYWSRGVAYVWDFVQPYWLAAPLAAVGLLIGVEMQLRRREREQPRAMREAVIIAAPVISSLGLSTYVTAIGGDWMQARMLLPPIFLLVLPVLLVRVSRLTIPLVAVITAWAVLTMNPLHSLLQGGGKTANKNIGNIRIDDQMWTQRVNPVSATDWLNGFPWLPVAVDRAAGAPKPVLVYGPNDSLTVPARSDAGVSVAMTGGFLGVTGAVVPLDYRIVDVFGLAYPLDAHFELVERGPPGHEKQLRHVWLLADYADPAEVPPQGVGPEGSTPAAVAAARHALTCGELHELQMSIREPMSWRRFQQNLTGALRRTLLRIPPDPFVAEQRFCRGSDPNLGIPDK
jgi:arabinofuranosyltransferase